MSILMCKKWIKWTKYLNHVQAQTIIHITKWEIRRNKRMVEIDKEIQETIIEEMEQD